MLETMNPGDEDEYDIFNRRLNQSNINSYTDSNDSTENMRLALALPNLNEHRGAHAGMISSNVASIQGSGIPLARDLVSFGLDANDDCATSRLPFSQAIEEYGSIDISGKKRKKDQQPNPKPKRPLSAYNYFFHNERQKMLENMPTRAEGKPRRSHGKIGFADLARNIAAKWKSISDEERKTFDEKAMEDKERYSKEMEEWKASQLLEVSHAAAMNASSFHQPGIDQSGPFGSYGHSTFVGYQSQGMFPSQQAAIHPAQAAQSSFTLPQHHSMSSNSNKKGGEFSNVYNLVNTDPTFTIAEAYALNRAQRSQARINASLDAMSQFSTSTGTGTVATGAIGQEGFMQNRHTTNLDGTSLLNNMRQNQQQRHENDTNRTTGQQPSQPPLPTSEQISELATQLDDESTQLLLNIFR
jgi:HMG-box domain